MTLPVILQEHRNKALETGLARFYTTINQAFKASEVDNGEQKYWDYNLNSCDFFMKYLKNYLRVTNYECGYYQKNENGTYSKIDDDRFVGIYLPSGDMAVFSYTSKLVYMIKTKNHYQAYAAMTSGNPEDNPDLYGRELFSFEIARTRAGIDKDGVEPFDGLRIYSDEQIKQKCIEYPSRCVEMIRRNGWKIPKDYPYRIK